MTRGQAESEPAGNAGEAFYVLAMYDGDGDGLTADELHRHVAAENTALGDPFPDREQIRAALEGLARRALVERATLSRRGVTPRWQVTDYGYRMLAAWAGGSEADRVPCGLGWPP